jgi:hypothetical protein
LRRSVNKLSRRSAKPMRRPRRNDASPRRLLPRLRPRPLRLLRLLRLRLLRLRLLRRPRLQRSPRRSLLPRLRLLSQPTASRRSLSEPVSPVKVLPLTPSREPLRPQAGALLLVTSEDSAGDLVPGADVVVDVVLGTHDLPVPTELLVSRLLAMPKPQLRLPTRTDGPQCPRRVARDVRWHPRMCTYRPVSLRFDD